MPLELRLEGLSREDRDIILAGSLINYYATVIRAVRIAISCRHSSMAFSSRCRAIAGENSER